MRSPIHSGRAARGPALLAVIGGTGAALALAALAGIGGLPGGIGDTRAPVAALVPRDGGGRSVSTPTASGTRAVVRAPSQAPRVATGFAGPSRDGRDALALAIAAARVRDSGEHLDPPSERELHKAYLARAREDAAGLEREAGALLAAGAPDNQRIALLLALHEAGTPRAEEFVLSALRDLPSEREGALASVPEVLVRRLGQQCGRDSAAARTLLIALSTGTLCERPALRRRAVRGLAVYGSSETVSRLEDFLALETDASVVEVARSALAARRSETIERG